MKRFLLLAASLLLAHHQYAQDCTPGSPPYLENFETVTAPALPNCLAAGSGGFTTVNNPGNGFTSNTLQYTGGAQASDTWLFTKGVHLEPGYYRVNYKYGNLGTDVQTAQFGYSTANNGSSFTIAGGPITPSDGTLHTANFSYLEFTQAGTYYFGYHITSAAGSGSLLLDDISIQPSTCGIPGFLNASAVTQNSATLSWEATTTGNVSTLWYQYVVSTSPATPATGTNNYTLNKALTGLQPATTYYVFVRSSCSNSLWSDWVTTTFTTLPCDAVATPYTLDFESTTIPAVPQCTSATVPPTGNGWVTANNPGNGFTNNTLVYNGTAAAADAWFFSRGVQLNAGTYYQISYEYGNNSTSTSEKLKVIWGTSPNATVIPANITEHVAEGGQVQNVLLNFVTVPVSGVYYFGFNAHSDASQGSLYVDDFTVEPSLCGTPANVTVTPGQTTATVNWGVPTTGNAMVTVYQYAKGTTTTPPAEGLYTTALTAELTSLQPNTAYYAFTRALCGQVWSDWTVTPFNSLPVCEAAPLPYTIDFESAILPGIPECTSTETFGNGNNWATTNNPGSGFTTNTLQYSAATANADAWFYTKGVLLDQNKRYKISFRYGNNDTATTEKIILTRFLSSDPNQSQTNIAELETAAGTPQNYVYNYATVPATGIYYFGFGAQSDASQGNLYIDDISIEESLCGTPENVVVTTTTQTGATVNWSVPSTGNSPASFYQYAYSTSSEPPASGNFIQGNTLTLSGLTPGTDYYVFTRSACAMLYSEWTVTPFTTADCAPATVPFTLDFETSASPELPVCTTSSSSNGSGSWTVTDNPGNGFTGKTLQYTATDSAANAWFFTNGIQLTAGTYYRVSYRYGNDSAATTEKLLVNLFYTQNPGTPAPFADYSTITGGTAQNAVANYVTVATTGVYFFGFKAYSDAGQSNLYVDDLTIEESVCGQPANVSVTGITPTGATINWGIPTTGNSEVTVYQYYYGTTATPPADGLFLQAYTTNLTNLQPATDYYAFTRTRCGQIWSSWTVTPFTTPSDVTCNPETVPYTLDFETTFVPAIPGCTYTAPVADGNNNWVTANNPGNGFTSNTLSYTATANAANAWFFTSGVQLEAGKYYKVSFKYGNNSATITEKLFVNQYSAPNSAATIPGFAGSEYTVTAGQPATQVNDYVTVPTTGVYYFGFNAHSDASQGSLYMDNFSIVESVCGEPADVTVDNISQTGATVNWAIPNTGNSPVNVYQYAYGTTDTPPAEGEFISELTKDLTGLTPGTDYYVFTRSLCGQIFSEWTVTPFTTLDETAGLDDYTLSSLKVYPNPTKDVVRIANSNTIDKVDIYNITGQLILSQAINSQEAEINLQHLAAGAYFMNVQANGAVKKVKVIKQ